MSLAKVFCEHLNDFYNELIILYPKNNELKAGRTIVETFKKFNPKKLLESWKILILIPYENQVLAGNLDFFLNHNFQNEIQSGKYTKKESEDWMEEIKNLVRNMEDENLQKSIKYFQNLTKICKLYYKSK